LQSLALLDRRLDVKKTVSKQISSWLVAKTRGLLCSLMHTESMARERRIVTGFLSSKGRDLLERRARDRRFESFNS